MKNAPKQVLICVTRQKACEKLIKAGVALAQERGEAVTVVHVARPGENLLGNPMEGEALEYLFTIAKKYDVPMQMLRSDKVAKTLTQYARENHVDCMVIGSAGDPRSLVQEIQREIPGMEFHMESYSE